MYRTVATENLESNDVIAMCYLFEISTAGHLIVLGGLQPGR
jgi:hypothetical protein